MRVLMIVAPFGLIEYPNLAASLLKAEAEQAGFPCRIHYCSIEFAQRIGWNAYRTCYYSDPYILLGERVFAPAVFGDAIPSWTTYWNDVMVPYERPNWKFIRSPEHHGLNRRAFEVLQDDALAYIEEYTARADFADYDVFAVSTSYGQNLASLAIAKRLKARFPRKPVVFGGANCHGVMGEQMLRSFSFIDYVCTAEGDVAFPELLRCLEAGRPCSVPGIVLRAADGSVPPAGAPVMINDLDALPYPDFSEYFEAFHFRTAERAVTAAIPMETSRGCWWGEKHHCVFCGLNGETMRYRSKSPRRVIDEMEALIDRFGLAKIMMTDNIMHNRSVDELLPLLERKREDLEIFFEVKANLTRSDLQSLVASGVTYIQPGIESLSTHVLDLMDKGCDSFQNLQLLKWTKELAIAVSWNILCGFPGETDEDYETFAELIPKVYHMTPPRGFGQISVDRFSPMFKWPERFDIRIHPARAYRYVYALPDADIWNLAYTFSFAGERANTSESMSPPSYARRAYQAYLVWKRFYGRVDFSYDVSAAGSVLVHDTRPIAEVENRELDPLESAVFLCLDSAQSLTAILRTLESDYGVRATPQSVTDVLARFELRGYLHIERGKYLALANRRHDARPAACFRGLEAVVGM